MRPLLTAPHRVARRRTALLLLGLVAGGLGGAAYVAGQRPPRLRAERFRLAAWYWHQPVALPRHDDALIGTGRIERFCYLAGTVDPSPEAGLVLRRTAVKRLPTAAELVAVLRCTPDSLRVLLGTNGADEVARLVAGLGLPTSVREIQIDADTPTASLRKYAGFFRALRQRLGDRFRLGATGLPDWLGTPDYAALCDSLDSITPQFYGNTWPVRGRPAPRLWETGSLMDEIRRAHAGRALVWVGLPIYGRCIVFDPEGEAVGLRHDLDPWSFLRDSRWVVTRREVIRAPKPGPAMESNVEFRCVQPGGSHPVGTRLCFQWPEPAGVRDLINRLRTVPLEGVAGIHLFRWPIPGEPLAGDLRHLLRPAASLAPGVRTVRRGKALELRYANPSDETQGLAMPMRLRVTLEGGVWRGDWEAAWLCGNRRCSPVRADSVLVELPFVRPGREITIGRLTGQQREPTFGFTDQELRDPP